MRRTSPKTAALFPGLEMLTWLPLLGMLLIGVNDHLIRRNHPSFVTGKLSDFAVVVYFPFLVTSVWRLLAFALDRILGAFYPGRFHIDWGFTKTKLAWGIGITAFGLTSVNVSETARDLYVALLERVDVFGLFGRFVYVKDPTDCAALMLLPLVWMHGTRRFVQPG